jgi:hypothetical protein
MRVALHGRELQAGWAYLRPLTGHDELALGPGSEHAGNWLLQRLLDGRPGGALGPDGLGGLDIGDRDRLLAAVFKACFGEDVEGTANCAHCGEDFAFHFTLEALEQHRIQADDAPAEGPDAEGYYRVDDVRFRLPTVADLDSVSALSADRAVAALLVRCVAPGGAVADAETIQQAMERLAPSLDLDIDAACPNCAQPATIAFSLEAFLMQALTQERRFLTAEIHRLAAAYGWSLDEILRLSREDRQSLVRLVETERQAGSWR